MSGLDARLEVPDRLDAAISAAPGEVVAVLGPNGAGKSTLVHALAGLQAATGTVRLAGADIAGRLPHERNVGLVFQDRRLFPHLSALENVAFGPRSRGVGRSAARAGATQWLERFGVGDLARRRPGEMSGGQAQRVAIARALAGDPDLLLLDEPFSGLDVEVAAALRTELAHHLADYRGVTVLVTHHVLDALLLADRIVVLDRGRVSEAGTAAEVLTRPRSGFTARFAGLNLVAGVATSVAGARGVRRTDGLEVAGVDERSATVPGEPAVAVFRPSAVSVHTRPPGGSPRNAIAVTVSELEPHGDVVRVRGDGLAADVTLAAAADLALTPGSTVTFVIKATEVAIHPR